MLSVRKLAECANVSPQTIFNYVSNGYLVPSEVTPDGRYFFEERAVGQVLTKKYEKTFRKGILVVHFTRTEGEAQVVEDFLKETSLQRCDDIVEYIYEMRSQVREEQDYQIECFKYASSEVVRKCKDGLTLLQAEYKRKLVETSEVDNVQEVFRRFSEIIAIGRYSNKLVETSEVDNVQEVFRRFSEIIAIGRYSNVQVRLSTNDEEILARFANAYMCEMKEVTEKYRVNEMGEIAKKLVTEPETVLAYKPKGIEAERSWRAYMCEMKEVTEKYRVNEMGEIAKKLVTEPETVLAYKPKGIEAERSWRAAEAKYYNSKIDSIVKEELEKGYVSYLMLVEGEDNRILKLLEKGMSEGYSRIVIFNSSLATPEEQEVLKFIEERKKTLYMDSEEGIAWSADGTDDASDSN